MLRDQYIKFSLILGLLLFGFTLQAQYLVSGGSGVPMLAKDDTYNRLQVYLLNGVSQSEIRYTSASTGTHKWFRYSKSALNPESVASTQQGNVSFVTNPEEGYGYFVEVPGELSRYVWIIDYSLYPAELRSLDLSQQPDPCAFLKLSGDMTMSKLLYYLPNGIPAELNRQFEVTYQTLEWSENLGLFSQKEVIELINGSPAEATVKAPLCNTEVKVSGDLFARHFNMEKKIVSGVYEAVSVEVHGFADKMNTDAENVVTNSVVDLGGSAPVEIRFKAVANDPVAALYVWKIYKKEESSETPLVRFPGEELVFIFDKFGDYLAELEVTDRSGKCSDNSYSREIKIVESSLEIPNAFSPGTSPGINDEFRVAYKSLVKFNGTIFNRWGVEMFHWTNPAEGWDGKKGGKYVTPGVYFYIIEAEGAEGKKYNRKGDINILRSKNVENE